MLISLKRLRRREANVREFRSLDDHLRDDIGLGGCDWPYAQDTNNLLLMHRGPFDR